MNISDAPSCTARKISCRLLFFIVLVTTLGVTTVSSSFATEQTLTQVDRNLPDFSLQGVDGTVYEPETLKGKTWLINFWAVWCAPCLEELPALNNAWAKLQNNNVGMLAINIGDEAKTIEQFLAANNLQIDFPIVIGDKIRTLGNWSGTGLPFTVIVNPSGSIVYEAVGPREWDDQQYIDAILALNNASSDSISAQLHPMLLQLRSLPTSIKVIAVLILLLAFFALIDSISSVISPKKVR